MTSCASEHIYHLTPQLGDAHSRGFCKVAHSNVDVSSRLAFSSWMWPLG